MAAVGGWLVFQGAAVALVLSGSTWPGVLAEGAALVSAGALWLLGARGGRLMIVNTSTAGRKARG